MSELQTGLVVAGVVAVAAVYAYNVWTHARRRREIERAVAEHSARRASVDPLDIPAINRAGSEPLVGPADDLPAAAEPQWTVGQGDSPAGVTDHQADDAVGGHAAEAPGAVTEPVSAAASELSPSLVVTTRDQAAPHDTVEDDEPETPPLRPRVPAPAPDTDRLDLRADPPDCDRRADHIVRLLPLEPVAAEQVRDWLARAPDTAKTLQVLGCPVGEQDWQPVLQSDARYEELAFCQQLVDRRGLIERSALERFRSWVDEIADDLATAPNAVSIDVAYSTARQFDTFCAQADVLIGVNVIAPDVPVPATKLRALAESSGFRLQVDGHYTLEDDNGAVLMTLSDIEGKPFVADRIRTAATSGVTLVLDIPRTQRPGRVFGQMLAIARQIATGIGGRLVDDQRQLLTDAGVRVISNRIGALEQSLEAERLMPGSTLAKRVFA